MKKLVLLFAALLVAGCGEKKATGDNGGDGNDEGAPAGVARRISSGFVEAVFGPRMANRLSHYLVSTASAKGASLSSNLERGLSLARSSVGE